MQRRTSKPFIESDKQEFLTQLAEDIADVYFKEDEKITPSIIANDYGITYSKGEYGDSFDGLIEHNRGRFHIYINEEKSNNERRQRFTFGHELGHFFVDGHRNALASGEVPYLSCHTEFASEYVVEREADFFSASLLMPRNRVISDYQKHRKFSFKIIEKLSTKYDVSILSVIFRVFFLDLHPMMFVKAQRGEIKHIFTSRDFYQYPKHKKTRIPEDSIMYDFFSKGKKYPKTEQIWMGDWFNRRGEGKLYEKCIYHDYSETCYSLVWMD